MTYRLNYETDGTVIGVSRINDNGTETSGTKDTQLWQDFLAWNALQPVPLDYTAPGPKARRLRTVAAIRSDLQALTNQQRQAVWNDIQFRLVARWCQEHPEYLVAPAFAPEIDLPGDAPG